jgi:uncharacterized membrane protein YbhN (UPF0104 family)
LTSRIKSIIQFSVITLIGGFFLYFVFKGIDWSDLLDKFNHTNYGWIAIGLFIAMISHFIRAYRATMLYDVLGYKVPVSNSFYAVMIGYMMNYIIPRAGEVSRCAALTKTDDIPVNKSLGTVVTERVFDMVILLLFLGVVFFVQFDMINGYIQKSFSGKDVEASGISLKWILAGIVAVGGVLFWVLRKKLATHPLYDKVMTMLKGFAEGLLSIRQVKRPFLFIVLSLMIWLCYLLMMYFCLFSMEATSHLSFMDCVTVFAIGTIGVVIPAPGAGAGTYHFAVMQSLLLFGVPEADGIAYATIVHGVQMIMFLLVGGLCSLAVLAMHKKKSV